MPEVDMQRRRVLVVDDDPVLRMLVARALDKMGFVSEGASDGLAALESIRADPPDLVILDLEMPGLDGFETCEAIRTSEETCEIPVLIATGLTDHETIDRAYHVGATDFLKKPIDLSILRHHVRFIMRASDTFAELRRTLSELEASDRRLEGAQELAHLGHWEWSAEADEMLWSSETYRILGLEPNAEPATLDAFLNAIHSDDRAAIEKRFQASSLEQTDWSLDHRILTRRGETRVVQQHASVTSDHGEICVSGTIQDITERRRAEDQIDYLAHFDSLTSLPNRKRLCERLDRLLTRAGHDNEVVGMIRLNLDRFKRVNDTLGQKVGDHLLRSVAKRLQSCVRATDLVTHAEIDDTAVSSLGADEFSVVLTQVRSSKDVSYVARRILGCLEDPFITHGHEIETTASIGVAMFPADGDDAEKLIRSAGTAMNHAKHLGGGSFRFCDAEMNDRASRHMQIEMGLQSAVERGELRLAYQPQWDSDTGRMTGMEALLRWRSEKLGDVSPGEFIPVAEDANLVQRLGEWVFEEACRQLQAWEHQGIERVPIAVNFSSRQLRSPEIAGQVERVMQQFEVDPSLIEVEMTESAFVGDLDEVMEVLSSIKRTGVRIALDDFGTGYSSISHLAHFPIDILKIDQSFVSRIGEETQDATLVSALIAMARRLSLQVVAEGVETEEQADFLRDEGCHVLQGFLLAKPLDVETATDLLINERAGA